MNNSDSLSQALTDDVLDIAMVAFAQSGYADTRLDSIAKESGMTKRMIHYHFGDKKGLYHSCLIHAIELLRPSAEEIQNDSGIAAEGIRIIVEAIFRCYIQNPHAVRLLLIENLHHPDAVEDTKLLDDQSAVILELDKILMQGQDSGAFRPGISAQDIFALIVSLAIFRISHRSITLNLYDIDLADDANTQGLTRMATDAVLAFLTSPIKATDEVSYLGSSDNATNANYNNGYLNFGIDGDL
ncbi:TetR/AcrR family transcriptional regulator [Corynebacterium sp. sy017]|uniref:TetR family transcriptional regulator n=1 Tax=unclassified Corynebacterium TaxID=2624378 RepID=UPI001185E211|nr:MULTISPECIES: TetR family transcriptional regulator [unclassified Corynebacterium]MBP3088131.1 TetR/AcrR family transcriptional regulator [Corynebacterium sp. sy017]QDZ43075.1 TetR/AcrR family transcriptional regulator [Corynebacterium sp. sy039]TSD92649.1 TetR/AcrR family transcriptional regulator [Corynebacterium sp. SY003]